MYKDDGVYEYLDFSQLHYHSLIVSCFFLSCLLLPSYPTPFLTLSVSRSVSLATVRRHQMGVHVQHPYLCMTQVEPCVCAHAIVCVCLYSMIASCVNFLHVPNRKELGNVIGLSRMSASKRANEHTSKKEWVGAKKKKNTQILCSSVCILGTMC